MEDKRNLYIIGTVVSLGFILTVVALYLNAVNQQRQIQSNTDTNIIVSNNVVEDTDNSEIETSKDFTSERYDFSLTYPQSFGDAEVEYKDDYFYDEVLTFTNYNLSIVYPRWEGGFGPSIEMAEAMSADGHKYIISIYDNGGNADKYTVFATSGYNQSTGATVVMMSQQLSTKGEADAIFSQLKDQLIPTVKGNLSVRPENLVTFESDRYNISFNYPSDLGSPQVDFKDNYYDVEGGVLLEI